LASRRTDALTSAFRPTYNMAANLVRRYSKFEAHHLLNLSFAQYHADRDVVALERQLERSRAHLVRQLELAQNDDGDVRGYARLQAELEAARRDRGGGARRIADAIETLRPGDVVLVRGRGGRVVVLAHDQRRKQTPRIVGIDTRRDVVRLGPDDFDAPPRRVATIELPREYAPRNPGYRKQVADRLRSAKLRDDKGRPKRHDRRIAELEAAIAQHPLAGDPGLRARLRAANAVERLERDVQRLERRIRGRNDSLARQFDRVLRVLESWGYVEGWSLTPAGERLARLYTETDLLLAEAIGEGLLDGLRVPELAAVVSCFTYERRGPEGDQPMPPPHWPTKTVAVRSRAIEKLGRDLNADEDDAGLPETRTPDPGFTAYVHEWAAGESLADVLADDEMTGGDFVRHVKQCIDLLRQIGDVAPNDDTRRKAREAADACHRGVVAASGVAPAT
jgi:ATP-dependent RNA helicase HelY